MKFVETRSGPAGRAIAIWISWIIVNAVGSSAAIIVGFGLIVVTSIERPDLPVYELPDRLFVNAFAGLMMGLVTGSTQWLILHKRFHGGLRWVLLTGIGWSLGLVLGISVDDWLWYARNVESSLLTATVVVTLWFGLIGVIQSVFFRNASRSVWWVFATWLGWTLALVGLERNTIPEPVMLRFVLSAIIAGAPSGLLLVSWLGPAEEGEQPEAVREQG